MRFQRNDIRDIEVIRVATKSLDADNVSDFRRGLEPLLGSATKVVLDMEQVAFVDSSGLGAILTFVRNLGAEGVELKLCNAARAVKSVMRMVGMHRVIQSFESLDDAVASFGESGEGKAASDAA